MRGVQNGMADGSAADEMTNAPVSGGRPSEPASGAGSGVFKKALLLGAGLIVLGVLATLPSVRHAILDDKERAKEFIAHCGPWAPVVFTLTVAILVGCGFSRLACHFLGGALFAFWGGLAWSLIGAMIGNTAVFFAVRRLGMREVILRKHPTWQKWALKLKQNTVPAVILFRQLPLPGGMVNVVLGLSPIRRREYLLGTCIGLLPEAVPTVLLGTGLRKEDLKLTVIYMIAAVALFVLGWIAWGVHRRRLTANEPGADENPPNPQ
jgi:uncharacterized membrane protein YdjX (TVP38/TMEM64 family)